MLYPHGELPDVWVFQHFERVHEEALDYIPLSMGAQYLKIDLQARDVVFNCYNNNNNNCFYWSNAYESTLYITRGPITVTCYPACTVIFKRDCQLNPWYEFKKLQSDWFNSNNFPTSKVLLNPSFFFMVKCYSNGFFRCCTSSMGKW